MKNKIITFNKYIFAALLLFALAIGAAAQTVTFREGNSVQTPDGRIGVIESFKNQEMAKVKFGENDSQYFMLTTLKVVKPPKPPRTEPPETFRAGDLVENDKGQQLRIDSISGDSAVVRYGVGKYNVYTEKLENLTSVKTVAARRERDNAGKLVRAQFEDDSKPFFDLIITVAPGFDPKYRLEFSFNPVNATYEKWTKELTALSVVCQKYPNLTNPLDADKDSIRKNVADWCKIAEQRTAVVKRMRTIVGEQRINGDIARWISEINGALRDSHGHVSDELQMLLYDRAAWELRELKFARKIYADAGVEMPMKTFAPLDEKVAELKAKIEQEAPTRSWEPLKLTDAASEGTVKRAYPTQFPGVQIHKTGMLFATWKAVDDASLVNSSSDVKIYLITKGAYRYKLGLSLVKLPNRPFCQIRQFQVTQHKAGAGYGAAKAGIAGVGVFVKCP